MNAPHDLLNVFEVDIHAGNTDKFAVDEQRNDVRNNLCVDVLILIRRNPGGNLALFWNVIPSHMCQIIRRVASDIGQLERIKHVLVTHFCNSTAYNFINDIELRKEFDIVYMNVVCPGPDVINHCK